MRRVGPRRPARRAACAALLGALALVPGCFASPLVLAHDMILGPISPAGRLRPAVAGRDLRPGAEGRVVADVSGQSVFRPYSPEIIRTFPLLPRNLSLLTTLGKELVASFSPLTRRDARVGVPLDRAQRAGLRRGLTALEVLDLLGPPQLWIRRKEGSIMAYRAEVGEALSLYVGLPPFVSNFLPIPFLDAVSFRYIKNERRPHKTILFLDEADVLRAVVSNDPARSDPARSDPARSDPEGAR